MASFSLLFFAKEKFISRNMRGMYNCTYIWSTFNNNCGNCRLKIFTITIWNIIVIRYYYFETNYISLSSFIFYSNNHCNRRQFYIYYIYTHIYTCKYIFLIILKGMKYLLHHKKHWDIHIFRVANNIHVFSRKYSLAEFEESDHDDESLGRAGNKL